MIRHAAWLVLSIGLLGCGGGGGSDDAVPVNQSSDASSTTSTIATESSADSASAEISSDTPVVSESGLPTTDAAKALNCDSASEKKRYVYDTMKDIYLWNDTLPVVDTDSYKTEAELLNAIMYKPTDKWSSISSAEQFNTYFEEGKALGYGFRMKYDSEENIRLSYVWPLSPIGKAGIQRGYQLLEVNGTPVADIANWGAALGSEEGTEAMLKLEDFDERIITVTVKQSWYDITTVNKPLAYTVNGKLIGYFSLSGFIDSTYTEVYNLFNWFKEKGVDSIIIDVRYNTGGKLGVAAYIASLLNPGHAEETFVKLAHNAQNQSRDIVYRYKELDNSIDVNKIYILTTNSSASASEMLISGLKPYADVTVVGTATHGKPVGSSPTQYCDQVLTPIIFSVKNTNGGGDYFEGIPADCLAIDNPIADLGEVREPMLNAALAHFNDGTCIQPLAKGEAGESKAIEYEGYNAMTGAY